MELATEPAARGTRALSSSALHDSANDSRIEDVDLNGAVLHSKQYRIADRIGQGGMGTVYRAYDPVLERDVALKVLSPTLSASARRRFRSEARHGARLCHPNLVRVFDLGVLPASGAEWFAMEYLVGHDLETLMARAGERRRSLSSRFLALVFDRVLDALGYVHDFGLVHRDVKPANIFITRLAGETFGVKLLDFGVALDASSKGSEDEICGDPRYIAPEQAQGAHVDGRADLYATGISLFEALAGRHPFASQVTTSLEAAACAHHQASLPSVMPWLPEDWAVSQRYEVDQLLQQACDKCAERRFRTAHEMRQALRATLGVDSSWGATAHTL